MRDSSKRYAKIVQKLRKAIAKDKLKLFDAVVTSAVMYGAAIWTLTFFGVHFESN